MLGEEAFLQFSNVLINTIRFIKSLIVQLIRLMVFSLMLNNIPLEYLAACKIIRLSMIEGARL